MNPQTERRRGGDKKKKNRALSYVSDPELSGGRNSVRDRGREEEEGGLQPQELCGFTQAFLSLSSLFVKKLTHSGARTHTRGAHEEGPTGERRGWGGEEEKEKVSSEIKGGEAVRKNKDALLYTHRGNKICIKQRGACG